MKSGAMMLKLLLQPRYSKLIMSIPSLVWNCDMKPKIMILPLSLMKQKLLTKVPDDPTKTMGLHSNLPIVVGGKYDIQACWGWGL